MAAPAPTTAKLMAIITTLQAQIVALQNVAPAAAAAQPAGAATVVFANTPQMLGANDLIDYSTKQESTIFEQGWKPLDDKALTDGFAMTPDQTVIFVEAFHRRATIIGWNQGTRQITSLLGIPIFGSDFWDPHWKRNSDFIFDSKDSGGNFFLEFRC
jgi:hypothetical protein